MLFEVINNALPDGAKPCKEAFRDPETGDWMVELKDIDAMVEFHDKYGSFLFESTRIEINDPTVAFEREE